MCLANNNNNTIQTNVIHYTSQEHIIIRINGISIN